MNLSTVEYAELNELMEVVDHPLVVVEVRRRFKYSYEEMAYSFYKNEYNLIGNTTELTEVHPGVVFNEFAEEIVPYIEALIYTPSI